MKMSEIMAKAKDLNIKSFGLKRDELIRGIQRAEGNFDCFGSASDYCDQDECTFRVLCLDGDQKAAKKARKKAAGSGEDD
ncbi:MAG: SAP domain-containing protein [Pseudomonadota bacterium]